MSLGVRLAVKRNVRLEHDDYSSVVLLRELFQYTDRDISKMWKIRPDMVERIIQRWKKDIEWYDLVIV
jgi:DNA-directed RNA polymerase specialized sigma24 family protein